MAELEDIIPSDGAMGVATDALIIAVFDDEVTDGDWTLSVEGIKGSSALAADGGSATFVPDADLDQETVYTVTYSVCDDAGTSSFTTSGPTDAAALPGRAYLVDYLDIEWVEPAGIEALLGADTIESLLIQVTSYDPKTESLGLVGSLAEDLGAGPMQMACYEVMEFGSVDFSDNPTFVAGPSEMVVDAGGGMILTLEDLYYTATFGADASALYGVDITGYLDTRPLDSLGYGDICLLLGAMGISCVPCSDGADECIFTNLYAEEAAYVGDSLIDPAYDPSVDASCF